MGLLVPYRSETPVGAIGLQSGRPSVRPLLREVQCGVCGIEESVLWGEFALQGAPHYDIILPHTAKLWRVLCL